jgi:hypothetical protein
MPDPTAPIAPVTGKITVVNRDGLVAVGTIRWYESKTIRGALLMLGIFGPDLWMNVIRPWLDAPGPLAWSKLWRPAIVCITSVLIARWKLNDNRVVRS